MELRTSGVFDPPSLENPRGSSAELEVEALEREGVRGGAIWFVVPGPPDAVLEMLLDFDDATGHRSWAKEYSVVARSEELLVTRWVFEGKLGVNPTSEIIVAVEKVAGREVVRFHQKEPVFGLAAFFGDIQVVPLEGVVPLEDNGEQTLLAERIFIDSGLPFVNASEDDIEEGLREDARLIREWMKERLESKR